MLETLNAFLWGPGTLALILGTGAWLTLRTGGFPQRNLGQALVLSLGRDARRKGVNGVSPFGSLMTALATTVGTGNIVGVAAALVSGGPGALVWMELAAALGLAVKFAECMLAVKYRRIRSDGTRWGGPMAVMEARLGQLGKPLGKLYAFFALLMAFAMGAMAQSGALADTCAAAFSLSRRQVGLTAAALALTILLGGIRRIADASTLLVPVMALLYIGGGTADIAVISLSGVVESASIKIAGDQLNEAVVKYMRRKHNLLVGERTAEEMKKQIGCVFPKDEEETMDVKGRCLLTGLPKVVTVSSTEMMDAFEEPVERIMEAIHSVLERTPPELVADVSTNGIIMTGGGSLVYGFDKLVSARTGIHTTVAEDAISCVVLGTGKSLDSLNSMQDGTMNLSRRKQMT